MMTLASAVLLASFVGSLHCVGMCGPFALWATGGDGKVTTITAYHIGRLTTYLSAGLAAGLLGTAVQIGGGFAGFQSLAAQVAGGLLILIGLWRLMRMFPLLKSRTVTAKGHSWIARLLHNAKPLIADRTPAGRGYLVGLLTTWLPCGWLYLFVLIAAGTGDVILSLTVMFAFWAGTLPALTSLTLGVRSLVPRFRAVLPVAASLLLIATGLYTATGRASADLSTMVRPESGTELSSSQFDLSGMFELTDGPLPCCPPEG